MLKTRIITALALLAVLLPVLYFNNTTAFAVVASIFFGAAIWECFRLFNPQTGKAPLIAAFWTAAFVWAFFISPNPNPTFWFAISVLVWALRFVPSLKLGLPPLNSSANTFLSLVYAVAVVGCFAAIVEMYRHSPLYLLSVMAIVWAADIFAYISGKAFGKRKLAPSISPGKSWEGAIGGCIAVLVLGTLSIVLARDALADTFLVQVQAQLGWAVLYLVLILIVAASVVGDLFESQLKRRAGFKDSSNLLPGHGGVLDRVDALVPVLPLAALIGSRIQSYAKESRNAAHYHPGRHRLDRRLDPRRSLPPSRALQRVRPQRPRPRRGTGRRLPPLQAGARGRRFA